MAEERKIKPYRDLAIREPLSEILRRVGYVRLSQNVLRETDPKRIDTYVRIALNGVKATQDKAMYDHALILFKRLGWARGKR